MELSVATRRVGIRKVVAATGSARFIFGPFVKGEKVKSFRLFVCMTDAANIDPVSGDATGIFFTGSGDGTKVNASAFRLPPGDSATIFAQMGRPLFVGPSGSADLMIPYQVLHADLPVEWTCDGEEVYLGLQITDVINSAGADMDFSVLLVMG